MSDFDVYSRDMSHRGLTHQDVERLLVGGVPAGDDLAGFAAVLESLHSTGPTTPDDEVVTAFSLRAAEFVRASRHDSPVASAPTVPRHRGRLSRQLAGGLGAALLLTGMTGVAVADDAVPGDPLYGLDRALESVGIGASGLPERIAEAQLLSQRGEITAAITHAAEAVEVTAQHDGDDQQSPFSESAKAVEALRGAAERVQSDQVDLKDPAVQAAVAAILGEIATMFDAEGLQPSELGRRISELARGIGRPGDTGRENAETPSPVDETSGPQPNAPAGSPSGVPAGPPDDIAGGPPAGTPAGPPDDPPRRTLP